MRLLAPRLRFTLTSDGERKQWNVSGPHFAGWEIYHFGKKVQAPPLQNQIVDLVIKALGA